MTALLVRSPGPFTSVQDLGRRRLAHFGVARSGAADRGSLRLANRLVGNPETSAALEVLAGGAVLEADGEAVLAVCGARCDVFVNGRLQARNVALSLGSGDVLRLGPTSRGVRAYVAVRGGLAVPEVLGSRAYDQLGDLGPPPLRTGDVLPVGQAGTGMPSWEEQPVADPALEPVLRVLPGPRTDWLADPGLHQLTGRTWEVQPSSDRTGVRLAGAPLVRRQDELESEGVVPGSVQVPADGLPILLGPDAGVTGGYPVVAVVIDADLDVIGQLAPGTSVRFHTIG